jgi:hypothetical protein
MTMIDLRSMRRGGERRQKTGDGRRGIRRLSSDCGFQFRGRRFRICGGTIGGCALLRDGIFTAAAPGMAAAEAFEGEPASGQRAVSGDSLDGVFRAGRGEAAAARGAEQEQFRRGNSPAIKAHSKNQDVLDRIHACYPYHPFDPFNNPAFRKVVKKSSSTRANPLPPIEGRATNTRSSGWASSC